MGPWMGRVHCPLPYHFFLPFILVLMPCLGEYSKLLLLIKIKNKKAVITMRYYQD